MRRLAASLLGIGAMCACQFSTVGSWTREAGPQAPIRTNWAVALADGRVAFFGTFNQQPANQMLLFDPATGAWTRGAPIPRAVYPDVIVRLQDGTVLMEGGLDAGGNITRATWLYDPTRNAWSAAGDVLEPRGGPAYTLLTDGRLLIAGGGTPLPQPVQLPNGTTVDSQAVTSAEIYDPQTKLWSQAGHMQVALNSIDLVALGGGGALAAGGCQGSAGYTPPVKTAEVFDPNTLEWTTTTPMPIAMCGGTGMALRDGRALVVDQSTFAFPYGFQFGSTDDSFVYDPKTRAWTGLGALAGGGSSAVMLSDGRVYVPEFEQGATTGHTYLEKIGGQIFDPSANQWTYATTTQVSLPVAYQFSGGEPLAVALSDGNALVFINTVTLAFHPSVAPPPTQVLDSTGLTFELGAAALVVVLLLVLAYRRATRVDIAKLA